MSRTSRRPVLLHRESSQLSVLSMGAGSVGSLDDEDSSSLNDDGSPEEDALLIGVSRDSETEALARSETAAVSRLRGAVVAVLLVAAVFVSAAVGVQSRAAQYEWSERMRRRMVAMEALAVEVQWTGGPNNDTASSPPWPDVTMPEFALRASCALDLAGADRVLWLPVVSNATRADWEHYSVEHYSSWVPTNRRNDGDDDGDSLASRYRRGNRFKSVARRVAEPSIDSRITNDDDRNTTISQHIFDANGVSSMRPGPFLPLWQTAPVPVDTEILGWINFDMLSLDALHDALTASLNSRKVVVGQVVVNTNANTTTTTSSLNNLILGDERDDAYDEPVSVIFYPVLDTASATTGTKSSNSNNNGVVAVLAFVSPWKYFFQNDVGSKAGGLVAVVENKCGQVYTFEINSAGSEGGVKFLGLGDLHHTSLDAMRQSMFGFGDNNSSDTAHHHLIPLNTDYCPYTLHIYPSIQMKREFVTNQPIWYAVTVALFFLLVTLVLAGYDWLVEERQKVIMEHAMQSGAIVSSLFPSQVRDRLFRRNSNDLPNEHQNDSQQPYASDDGSFSLLEPASNRLKSYLDRADNKGTAIGAPNTNDSKPIADLFPNCTVLFADISGFTAWSSIRDPAQVFTLLEAVYHTFDMIARKRKVFKVETIGDSYVAVTGLPDPQDDHAILMVRFARDCRNKMDEVTGKLVLALGPDTCDLKMRFGLHR
jgi:hypothetical protein